MEEALDLSSDRLPDEKYEHMSRVPLTSQNRRYCELTTNISSSHKLEKLVNFITYEYEHLSVKSQVYTYITTVMTASTELCAVRNS